MTQEEKQLLLKDLCARLPYGVVVHTDYKDIKLDREHCGVGVLYYEHYSEEAKKECGYDENDFNILISGCFYGNNIKPYLRPMSSMTEEELEELNKKFRRNIGYFFTQEPPYYYGLMVQHADAGSIIVSEFSEVYNWLNERHFDYRGLIEKGLALEAPEGMYGTEKI